MPRFGEAVRLIDGVTVTTSISSLTQVSLATGYNYNLETIGQAPAQNLPSAPANKGISLKADDDNTGSIFIGDASVTDSSGSKPGMRLKAGQSYSLQVSNANLVYAVASAAGQKLYWQVI